MITMYHYLALGLIIFIIGIVGSVLVKNVIKVLISIEFMLMGVNINFLTFAKYCDGIKMEGYIISLFYIAIGAAELAVALYMFYLMFNRKKSENIERYTEL